MRIIRGINSEIFSYKSKLDKKLLNKVIEFELVKDKRNWIAKQVEVDRMVPDFPDELTVFNITVIEEYGKVTEARLYVGVEGFSTWINLNRSELDNILKYGSTEFDEYNVIYRIKIK